MRHAAPPKNEAKRAPWRSVDRTFDWLRRIGAWRPSVVREPTLDEYLAHGRFPAPRARLLRDAVAKNRPFQRRDDSTQLFDKWEIILGMAFWGMPKKRPRGIQQQSIPTVARTGPWFWAYGNALKADWHSHHWIFYTAGANAEQIGGAFGRAVDKVQATGRRVKFLLDDQGNFDSTQTRFPQKTERRFINTYRPPKWCRHVLKRCKSVRGISRHGIKYFIRYTKQSGMPTTSNGNSPLNAGSHIDLARKAMRAIAVAKGTDPTVAELELPERCTLLVLGDDSLFVADEELIDAMATIGQQHFDDLGFEAKIIITDRIEMVEYCSGVFLPTADGYVWTQKPGRALSKMFWRLARSSPDTHEQWLAAVAQSWNHDANHCPVLRQATWLAARLACGAVPTERVKADRPRAYKIHHPTPQTWLFMCRRYSVSEDMLRDLEQAYRAMPLAAVLFDHPVLRRMTEIDCPVAHENCSGHLYEPSMLSRYSVLPPMTTQLWYPWDLRACGLAALVFSFCRSLYRSYLIASEKTSYCNDPLCPGAIKCDDECPNYLNRFMSDVKISVTEPVPANRGKQSKRGAKSAPSHSGRAAPNGNRNAGTKVSIPRSVGRPNPTAVVSVVSSARAADRVGTPKRRYPLVPIAGPRHKALMEKMVAKSMSQQAMALMASVMLPQEVLPERTPFSTSKPTAVASPFVGFSVPWDTANANTGGKDWVDVRQQFFSLSRDPRCAMTYWDPNPTMQSINKQVFFYGNTVSSVSPNAPELPSGEWFPMGVMKPNPSGLSPIYNPMPQGNCGNYETVFLDTEDVPMCLVTPRVSATASTTGTPGVTNILISGLANNTQYQFTVRRRWGAIHTDVAVQATSSATGTFGLGIADGAIGCYGVRLDGLGAGYVPGNLGQGAVQMNVISGTVIPTTNTAIGCGQFVSLFAPWFLLLSIFSNTFRIHSNALLVSNIMPKSGKSGEVVSYQVPAGNSWMDYIGSNSTATTDTFGLLFSLPDRKTVDFTKGLDAWLPLSDISQYDFKVVCDSAVGPSPLNQSTFLGNFSPFEPVPLANLDDNILVAIKASGSATLFGPQDCLGTWTTGMEFPTDAPFFECLKARIGPTLTQQILFDMRDAPFLLNNPIHVRDLIEYAKSVLKFVLPVGTGIASFFATEGNVGAALGMAASTKAALGAVLD
jgi:hypothetical protein